MRLKLPTLPSAAFVAAVLGLPATALQSGPPAGYYDSVDTSSTGALRSTLHAVIDDHQRFPYTSGSTDTWDILEAADNDPANSGRVLTVYRNASYPKAGGGNDFYNREHLWPVSYGYPQDNASNYPFTDCHALRLADDAYNSARNNKPFRNCDPGCEAWPTDFNSGNGGTGGAYPSDSNWTSGFGQSGTWEVWNIRRGDVARAILYMDLRYEGGNHTFTGANEPDLVVTNDPALIASGATGQNESLAYMGALDVLLEWHAADPVDDAERLRNDVVFGFQGNRNPFVDHPEWVDLAFSTVEPTIDPWINEFHYDNNGGDLGEFVEVAGPAGLDLGGYRLVAYNGSTGGEYDSESLSGVLPDEGLCIGTLAFPFANLQNGAPDGIALVDPSDNLIEFLSYEGTILATDGPAFGVASVDVGVSESSNGPLGVSLQRVGSGQTGGAFTWTGPAAESPGQANAGQTFTDACGSGGLPIPPTGLGGSSCAGLVELVWNPSNDPTVTGYRVWRSNTSGLGFQPLFATPIADTSYVDATAGTGSTVFYAVTAVTAAGESALGAELSITVQGASITGNPWINEFHYDNVSSDTGEFVELAGPSGLSLSGWALLGYNGATGNVYSTIGLSGVLPNNAECVGTRSFPFSGLQNGPADAIALVDPNGLVVEFLSYEGTMIAGSGPALGLSSQDVGVAESNSTPIGLSLQRVGTGAGASDFGAWSGPIVETPAVPNTGQTFSGGCQGVFEALPSPFNPADSLTLVDGVPALGQTLTLGIDNPLGTQTVGSLPFLAVSTQPALPGPTGLPIPGFGMGGGTGELFVSLAAGQLVQPYFSGPAWTGAGNPAPVVIELPVNCALAGVDLWLQGVLLDFFGGPAIGLTEGRRLGIAR